MIQKNEPWVEKYRPKKLNEIIGQKNTIEAVYNFWRNFKRSEGKALMLYGPPGSGKTSILCALAQQEALELVQINASDFRNKEHVERILKPATQQSSIYGYRKIVLIDEIDGMSGRADRGGVSAVVDVIKSTRFPIFITANDPWSNKLKTLRNYCQIIKLSKINYLSIMKHLNSICDMEDVVAEDIALKKIAISADGDMRAAINDLQAMSADGRIDNADLRIWNRERDETIMNALKLIFKSYDPKTALSVSDDLKENADELNLWLEQNIPLEYSIKSIPKATNFVSWSDVFLARIRRWQHWRFLLYAKILSVAGVQQAKKETNKKFLMYQKPGLILKMWRRAAKRKKARGIADQLEGKLHCSARVLQKDFMPYLEFIEKHNKDMYKIIATSLRI